MRERGELGKGFHRIMVHGNTGADRIFDSTSRSRLQSMWSSTTRSRASGPAPWPPSSTAWFSSAGPWRWSWCSGSWSLQLEQWAGAIFTLVYFASLWGYFAFFEGLRNGQTPGKRRLGIRVVRDTGHPVTFGAAAVRNLLRAADFLPPPYLIGGLLVALHPRAKRLGDLVAGTVVVRDRPTEVTARPTGASESSLRMREFRSSATRNSACCGNSPSGPRPWPRRCGSGWPFAWFRSSPTGTPIGLRRLNPSSPISTGMSWPDAGAGSGLEESPTRPNVAVRRLSPNAWRLESRNAGRPSSRWPIAPRA